MLFWIIILAVVILIISPLMWLLAPRIRRAAPEPGVPFRGSHAAQARRGSHARRMRVRRLSADERERFLVAWHSTRERFVEDPAQAISEADRLLGDIMEARGFPVLDFDAATIEMGADHPGVVEHYRPARRIARQSEAGAASTEALHKGLAHFKTMLDELLDVGRRPSLSGF